MEICFQTDKSRLAKLFVKFMTRYKNKFNRFKDTKKDLQEKLIKRENRFLQRKNQGKVIRDGRKKGPNR